MGEITGFLQRGERRFPAVMRWNNRGIITAVEPCRELSQDAPTLRAGKFNAHSHPEQSIYTDLVDKSWDLGTWCRNTIYRYSTVMTPRRVRLACRRAFARMLLNGTTAVMVSYYLHGRAGNDLDREVIAAARDVGIRLVFGRMNYDMVDRSAYEAKQLSQKFYFETPDEAEDHLRQLMDEEDDAVMICPALHSFHASTPQAMIRGINLGIELNRPVQLHLSEDRGDVELSRRQHGCRPVEYLDELRRSGRISSLSGVILSDCCWLDDHERRLIAENAMRVVLNPRMNDRVKTGFPDVAALLDAKIPLWCGTDGEASNDSLDVDDERTFLKKRLAGSVDPSAIDEIGRQSFDFGGSAMGPLEPGAWADFSVVKDGKLDGLYVGGRQVTSRGALVRLDVQRDIEIPLKAEIIAMTR